MVSKDDVPQPTQMPRTELQDKSITNPVDDPTWRFEEHPLEPSPFLKKPMFMHDWHFEKVFSITDYWDITTRAQGRPELEVVVQSEPEIKKKLPYLHTWLDNVQIFFARDSIFNELVGKYKWSVQEAVEKIVPDWNMKRFTGVYDSIGGDEDTKWVRTFDKVIKDKTGFENPAKVQKEYFAKIQRVYLKDKYKNDPEDWFKLLNIMNDLLGQIDSTEPKFTEDEMWGVFKQSVRGRWEDHAEAEGFVDDKKKFMKYCMDNHESDKDISAKVAKDNEDYLASLVGYLHY